MNPFQPPIGPFSQPEFGPEDAWLQEQETGFAPMQPLVTQQPGANMPDKSSRMANSGYAGLMALGLANTLTSSVDRNAEKLRMRRAMNTDSMSPSDPANPFGDYTLNAGVGNNFQPTMQNPTQRWGYEDGGELEQFPEGGPIKGRKPQSTGWSDQDSITRRLSREQFERSLPAGRPVKKDSTARVAPTSAPTEPSAFSRFFSTPSYPQSATAPRPTSGVDSISIYQQDIARRQAQVDQYYKAAPAEFNSRVAERGGLGHEEFVIETRPGATQPVGKLSGDLSCIRSGTCGVQAAARKAGINLPTFQDNNSFQAAAPGLGFVPVPGKEALTLPPGSPVIQSVPGSKYKHFTVLRGQSQNGNLYQAWQDHGNDAPELRVKPGEDNWDAKPQRMGMEADEVPQDHVQPEYLTGYRFDNGVTGQKKRLQNYQQRQRQGFKEGGEYQLSPWEIQELRAQGYEVEELD